MRKIHYMLALSAVLGLAGAITTPARAMGTGNRNPTPAASPVSLRCTHQADLLETVTKARDAGFGRGKVMRMAMNPSVVDGLSKEEGEQFQDGMVELVNMVYEHPEVTPDHVRASVYQACMEMVAGG